MARKSLVEAPRDRCFWVHEGPILQSLKDFEDALKEGRISDAQFRYHTGNGKNDFSSWISDVLQDPQCAKALLRIKTKKTALRIVDECLRGYH